MMLDDVAADPLTQPPGRPLWLVTLADLALLLLGFMVLVQASADRSAVTQSLRARFGDSEAPLPVAAAALDFAAGSAVPGDAAPLIAWTRDALRDPRTRVVVTGSADAGERGVLLAADRARAVAAALAAAGLATDRVQLATSPLPGRRVVLTLAFAGDPRSLS